jgi:hypothetical protein
MRVANYGCRSPEPIGRQAKGFPERVREISAGLVPVPQGLGHGLGQNLIDRARQIRPPRAQRWRRLVDVRIRQGRYLIPLVWHRPRQESVRDAGQCVLICTPIYRSALDLLGR